MKTNRHVWTRGCFFILPPLVLVSGILAQSEPRGFGDIPLAEDHYENSRAFLPTVLVDSAPFAYDARAAGIVTPPKNQGACGSCWAFAAVAALESHLLKFYGDAPRDLSEQQQVSCNMNMGGCGGGSGEALLFWTTKGANDETCFPYKDLTPTPCNQTCPQLPIRLKNWHTVPYDQFKASCMTLGPSYFRFALNGSEFTTFWYTATPGTAYVNHQPLTNGHAVLLIGWDDTKGAYLCKNSWGAGGPNGDGTFWIAYSGHTNDLQFQMFNFDLTLSTDLNGDGATDYQDYLQFRTALGKSRGEQGYNPYCDYDGDAKISYNDYILWYRSYRS